jgi:hypothetical protein
MQLKYRVWTVSGVKKKVVSDILSEYGVCVLGGKIIISNYHTKAQLYKSGSWNFLCIHRVPNRNVSKTNWNLQNFDINFLHVGTKHSYLIFLNWNIADLLTKNLGYFIISSPSVHKI